MINKKIAVSFGERTKRKPYLAALSHAGVNFIEDPTALDGFSGLMLTGGTDVDPARYRAERQPETKDIDPERDRRETALLNEALERDIPVLAICRGMQLLNVVCGGTLTQHIENHRHPDVADAHPIEIHEGTKLASILKSRHYQVNSRHHQCVHTLGEGLIKTATAPDGIIEALELPGKRFALAVQWHPEDRPETLDHKLFEAFAEAVTSAAPA
jgi:putative glutamine amidotransferase